MNVGNKSSFNLSNVNISDTVQEDVISIDTVQLTLPKQIVVSAEYLACVHGVKSECIPYLVYFERQRNATNHKISKS
jgi:hypothetical protein